MKEWLSEYGYLIFVLVAVCILAAVIFYFAVKAYSKHNALYKAQEAEMKRLIALKEKYMNFTEDTLENADKGEILEGVALSYQLRLQKDENPEKAFTLLAQEKQAVYVLDVFCADADIKVFFSENGKLVKDKIISALEMIDMQDFARRLMPVYKMFDPSDEDVSYNEKAIDELNEYMSLNDILGLIKEKGAIYIKNHISVLKN